MNVLHWLSHPVSAWRKWRDDRLKSGLRVLKYRYQIFRALLEDNHLAISLMTEIGARLRSGSITTGTVEKVSRLTGVVGEMIEKQSHLSSSSVNGLSGRFQTIRTEINTALASLPGPESHSFCLDLAEVETDMLRAVGGKASTLAQLKKMTRFTVPDGFVITASAGRFFLEQNGLLLSIMSRFRAALAQKQIPTEEELAKVRRQIMDASVPLALARRITEVSLPYFSEKSQHRFAVRSSAVSEDSQHHSFAGQYETVLNVNGLNSLFAAIKQVIASAFSGRNISYRLHGGLDPLEYDLAILCLEMVEPVSSGTLFTRDPNDPDSGRMLVSAVFGLGELAVSGSGSVDIYKPVRFGDEPPLTTIARKDKRIVAQPEGGTIVEDLPESMRQQPVLDEDQLARLTRAAIAIEMKLGFPQDIEWAIDEADRLIILQSRPFKIAARTKKGINLYVGRQVLLEGGMAASRGEGIGRAYVVNRREDLQKLPEGPLVLVLHQSLPDAVEVLDRVAALVVDLGNPVDHLSCVAREYSIPMLTGIEYATARITGEAWIAVNANEGRIYPATDEEAEHARRHFAADRAETVSRTPVARDPALGTLYESIMPLHLTDAYGPTFSIRECRSIHDIIRYIHEKAVLAMFESGDDLIDLSGTNAVRHLQTDVPFMVSIIDLGGGLKETGTRGRSITVDHIRSIPFNALWRGVRTEGLQWGPPAGEVSTGGVMSHWLTDHRAARPIGMPNYAILTRDYLNLNARMDFHFIMVDTLCGIDPRSNYIRFRFKGGGTTLTQRRRRIRCIAEILEAKGFLCNVQDDLITATLHGGSSGVIEEKLVTVGRLLGFTRLLDSAMVDDESVSATARAFLDGTFRLNLEKKRPRTVQA